MLTAKMGSEVIRAGKNLKYLDFVYRCRDSHCKAPELILVAGERGLRVPHFRHRVDSGCTCGKGETAWHLEWKSHFEKVEVDMGVDPVSGEMNRADALTGDGVVLEFQHSPISLEEQTARERFYTTKGGMIWVVDASRPRALARYQKAESGGLVVPKTEYTGCYSVAVDAKVFPDGWENRPVGVIFDYGSDRNLVFLLSGRDEGGALCRKFPREMLIKLLQSNGRKFLDGAEQIAERRRQELEAAQQKAIEDFVKQNQNVAQAQNAQPKVTHVALRQVPGQRTDIYEDENGRRYSDFFGTLLPLTEKFERKIQEALRRRQQYNRRRFRF